MDCPKCRSPMTAVTSHGIELDRCTQCEGLWFDAQEARKLKDLPGSGAVDVGHANIGKHYDEIREVDCPRCGVRMENIADPHQKHIILEHCPQCDGLFMDAGEFRDYRQEDLWDFLRMFFGRKGAGKKGSDGKKP